MHFADTMISFFKKKFINKFDIWAKNIIHDLLSYQEFFDYDEWNLEKCEYLRFKPLKPKFKIILLIKWKLIEWCKILFGQM